MKVNIYVGILTLFAFINSNVLFAQNPLLNEQLSTKHIIHKRISSHNDIPEKLKQLASNNTQALPQDIITYNWYPNVNEWGKIDSTHINYTSNGDIESITKYSVVGVPITKTIYGAKGPDIYTQFDWLTGYNGYTSITTLAWTPATNTWDSTKKYQFFFDEHQQVKTVLQLDYNAGGVAKWDTMMIEQYDNSYDNNGNLIERIYSYGDPFLALTPFEMDSMYYDQQNKLIEHTDKFFVNGSWRNVNKAFFGYDLQGTLREVDWWVFANGSWKGSQKFTDIDWFEYNGSTVHWFYSSKEKRKSHKVYLWDVQNNNYKNNFTIKFDRVYTDNYGSFTDSTQNFLSLSSTWYTDERTTNLFDSHHNETMYRKEYYDQPTNTFIIDMLLTFDFVYDGDFITEKVSEEYYPVQQFLRTKEVFKNYITVNTGVPIAKNAQNIKLYPNPTNGAGNLTFNLTNPAEMSIEVRNLLGQKIKTVLPNTKVNAGEYNFTIDLPHSGVYLVQVLANGQITTKKLVYTE